MKIFSYLTKWKYRVNPLKTLFFNFRMFDFNMAIKIPVLIANNVILRKLDGQIVLRNVNEKKGGG